MARRPLGCSCGTTGSPPSAHGISALERGYRRTPQPENLALLAGALALNGEQRREFEAAATRVGVVRRGTSVAVGPWPNTRIAGLPLALKSFVGRECELEEIGRMVREHRMVTLTGAGGVGKTQTALHVATALSDAADAADGGAAELPRGWRRRRDAGQLRAGGGGPDRVWGVRGEDSGVEEQSKKAKVESRESTGTNGGRCDVAMS